jgi:O-antigen/teichoic acid export membrane protein
MTGIRRAFISATIGRYLVMAINLAATLLMARLLAPGEYGVWVLGGAVFAVAEAMRALGGGAYLIQQKELSPENIRTSFTVSLIVTVVLTATVALLAGPLSRYFNTPDLGPYLLVAALSFLTGPFVYPISALMSRKMAFGTIAFVNVVAASINAAASIYLAILGFSYMSFAWAAAISSGSAMLLYLHYWRDWSVFRPILREWRSVITFGVYDSGTAVLSQIGEVLPYLIFGKILGAEAVALCQRAVLLCLFPERVILAGVGAVALPAFSRQIHEGRTLKGNYLRAIELITAAQWPALLLLICLAGPIVAALLGSQWRQVVPLVEILGAALLFSFPVTLHYPALVSVGAIRYMPPVVAIQAVVSIGLLSIAARHGLHAAALSMLLIVPFNGLLALGVVRHFVGFGWRDLAHALRKSAACAVLSAAGPAAIVAAGGTSDMGIVGAVSAVLLAALGWFLGLWATQHPLLHEMLHARDALQRVPSVAAISRVARRLLGLFGRGRAQNPKQSDRGQ